MRNILFLVINLFSFFAIAQSYNYNMSYGISTFLINPNGSFLPITYDDHPDWIVGAPASVNLNSVNLQGQFIKVKRQGAASLGVSWPDNTIYFNTIAVFTNGNLQIPAGDGTTAPGVGAYNFCPTSIFAHAIDLPYDLNIGGYPYINEQTYKLRVPLNATNLLIAPYDCPIHDNSDPDQNYKLEIRFPIVEKVDIYQVVKNPRLNSRSTFVDLVAGKNADIVIKTAPNINIEGSYIEWKSADGLLTKTFNVKPEQTTSTASGDVTFYIDPVPTEASFLNNGSSPIVHLKGRYNGQDVDYDQSSQYDLQVWPHKTKDIKLNFTALVGCTDDASTPCFTPTTDQQVNDMINYGVPLTNAMFPVREGGISYSKEKSSKVLGNDSLPAIPFLKLSVLQSDLFTIDKNFFLNLLPLNSKKNYTVGLGTQSYFKYRDEVDTVGIAFEIPGVIDMPIRVIQFLLMKVTIILCLMN